MVQEETSLKVVLKSTGQDLFTWSTKDESPQPLIKSEFNMSQMKNFMMDMEELVDCACDRRCRDF